MPDALPNTIRKRDGIDRIRNMDAFLIVQGIIEIITDFTDLLAALYGSG